MLFAHKPTPGQLSASQRCTMPGRLSSGWKILDATLALNLVNSKEAENGFKNLSGVFGWKAFCNASESLGGAPADNGILTYSALVNARILYGNAAYPILYSS